MTINSVLRWIFLLPSIILINLIVRKLWEWGYYYFVLIASSNKDFSVENLAHSWVNIIAFGFRDFLATYFSLYVAMKLITQGKKYAFYITSGLCILFFFLALTVEPVKFSGLPFMDIFVDWLILFSKGIGIFLAIRAIKNEFVYN